MREQKRKLTKPEADFLKRLTNFDELLARLIWKKGYKKAISGSFHVY